MLELKYFSAYDETPVTARDAYVAAELRKIVADGAPLLTSILRCPDDDAKSKALELLRDNATEMGERVFEAAPTFYRLRLAEDAKPPEKDPQGRRLPEHKRGNTLVVKLGNKGGRLGEKADKRLIEQFSGTRRQLLVGGGADLYEMAEVTRTPKAFAQRDAVLILKTWGVGVQTERCLTHYDRVKEEIVEGQSFYLVDEEPQSKDLAGPVDDKPAKAASKGR